MPLLHHHRKTDIAGISIIGNILARDIEPRDIAAKAIVASNMQRSAYRKGIAARNMQQETL